MYKHTYTKFFFFLTGSMPAAHRLDFLFMVHLSVGLTQRDLAHRFDIHQSTVSRIITTWANVLYSVLGSVCIWMSEEAVKAHMPKEF